MNNIYIIYDIYTAIPNRAGLAKVGQLYHYDLCSVHTL